jgi:ammonia channel protein AmtB
MEQGNTAFVLFSAALVLLMTPGLAFFYGGLVKAKSDTVVHGEEAYAFARGKD